MAFNDDPNNLIKVSDAKKLISKHWHNNTKPYLSTNRNKINQTYCCQQQIINQYNKHINDYNLFQQTTKNNIIVTKQHKSDLQRLKTSNQGKNNQLIKQTQQINELQNRMKYIENEHKHMNNKINKSNERINFNTLNVELLQSKICSTFELFIQQIKCNIEKDINQQNKAILFSSNGNRAKQIKIKIKNTFGNFGYGFFLKPQYIKIKNIGAANSICFNENSYKILGMNVYDPNDESQNAPLGLWCLDEIVCDFNDGWDVFGYQQHMNSTWNIAHMNVVKHVDGSFGGYHKECNNHNSKLIAVIAYKYRKNVGRLPLRY
eukprot:75837_1